MNTLRNILLIIAIIVLIINIIFTIREAIHTYHESTHLGRMQGESGAHDNPTAPAGVIRIAGLSYNVYWIIIGREGLIRLKEVDENEKKIKRS